MTFSRGSKDHDPWPELRRLFSAALQWIARYERWVLEVAGFAYHEVCVEQWFKEKLPARDMATAWEMMAERAPTAYFERSTSNN